MATSPVFSVQDVQQKEAPDDGASGQIVRWVSESLRSLICAHISELSSEAAVVFESPADIEAQGENKLSLYLYQIENNPWLRNLPPTLGTRSSASAGSHSLPVTPPPMVVDLIYMMVPYAKTAELELVLADKLMRLFHNISWLQGPLLHKGLAEAGNTSIQIVPRELSFDMLRDVWAGFPGKPYKFTRMYAASPVRIPSGPAFDEYVVGQVDMTLINTRPVPR